MMIKNAFLLFISILYSIWLWFWVIAVFTLHFILITLTAWMMPKPQLYSQYWAKYFLTFGMAMSGARLNTEGLENIPKEGPFILASNHQSLFDTALHIIKSHRLLLFTPKIELTKIPILGWDIKTQGHVSMDRSNPRNAVKSLQNIIKKLKQGQAFIFFPEGTRSTDDTIGPFKKGAFKVAHQAGAPVVPAYVHRAHVFLNKKRGLLATPTRVSVCYGEPIEPKETVEELMKATEAAVRNLQKNYLETT